MSLKSLFGEYEVAFIAGISVAGGLLLLGGVLICIYVYKRNRSGNGFEQYENQRLLDAPVESPSAPKEVYIGPQKATRASSYNPSTNLSRSDIKVNIPKPPLEDVTWKARMHLRSLSYFQNPVLLPEIGCRENDGKYFFVVEATSVTLNNRKLPSKVIMILTPIHPKSKIFSKTAFRKSFTDLLTSIDHPFILPIYQASAESLSANLAKTPTSTSLGVSLKSQPSSDKPETLNLITFRPLSTTGSLKDLIYNSKPTLKYHNKYSNGIPLQEQKISKIGKIILEALDYLNSQLNISICNLHSGNVIQYNNTWCLSEWENDFILWTPKNKKDFKQNPKKNASVVSFGSLLFEMSCGFEYDPEEEFIIPKQCSPRVAEILTKIFQSETEITLRDLLNLPFFSQIKLYEGADWVPKELIIEYKDLLVSMQGTNSKLIRSLITDKPKNKKKRAVSEYNKSTMSSSSSSSLLSTSSANLSTSAPPPPAPPPPPSFAPPPPPPPSVKSPDASVSEVPASSNERSSLLTSIRSFNSKKLKRTETKDKSKPKLSK